MSRCKLTKPPSKPNRLIEPPGKAGIAPEGTQDPDSTQPQFSSLELRYAVATDVGLVREANEDNHIMLPEFGVFVVADGMGGHVGGQLASTICVETIGEYFHEGRFGTLVDLDDFPQFMPESLQLAEAFHAANQHIFERSSANRELSGMGTTVVGIRIVGNRFGVSHVGDSRCYQLSGDQLTQITQDHSLSNFLRELGRLEEARYAEMARSNVIMRALGLEPSVVVSTREFIGQPGDRFLLCSDGLSDLVAHDVIADVMADPTRSLNELAQALIDLAIEAGGLDNITAMIVELGDSLEETVVPSDDEEDELLSLDVDAAYEETHVPDDED